MTSRHAEIRLDPSEKLVDSRKRQPGIEWPLAVDRWLDERLAQARRAGFGRATRMELVAALMTASTYEDDDLVKLLLRYNKMTNADLLGAPTGENVLTFTNPRSGPRTTKASK